ncbi:MAG: thioesterase family protein [Ilumatobacteraceae bacterium]
MRISHQPSKRPEDYAFQHRLRVRFAETDAMGIVHHAAYLPYLEEARVEWLRELGHPYDAMRAEGFDYAVLEVFTQYLRPLTFDEVVTVHVRMAAASRATFEIGYLITVEGEVRSTAVTVHGCVDQQGRPARLPVWLTALA